MDNVNNIKVSRKCTYNSQVDCNAPACWKCGWNPRVAKERIDKLLHIRARSSIRDVMCFD